MSTLFSRLPIKKEQDFIEGVKLLNHWLDGVVARGLYANKDLEDSLNEISARLVDKGLPGLARKLRRIPEVLAASKDQMDFILLLLGELYLFCRKVELLSGLQELEKEDLLTYAGVPYSKKLFTEHQFVQDHWVYLGMARDQEENMFVYRHWFYGVSTRAKCLFLEFKFGPWNRPTSFVLGKHYYGAVQFYPSMTPLRIADPPARNFINGPNKEMELHTLGKALDHFTWLMSHNPFLLNNIYVLQNVKLLTENHEWYVTDGGENCVLLENGLEVMPQLLSLSDHPKCQFVVEYAAHRIRVISLIVDGKYFSAGI